VKKIELLKRGIEIYNKRKWTVIRDAEDPESSTTADKIRNNELLTLSEVYLNILLEVCGVDYMVIESREAGVKYDKIVLKEDASAEIPLEEKQVEEMGINEILRRQLSILASVSGNANAEELPQLTKALLNVVVHLCR
jgi:hypothetical protein